MTKNISYTIMMVASLITWIWASIEPLHFDDWLLENILVFIIIPVFFYKTIF